MINIETLKLRFVLHIFVRFSNFFSCCFAKSTYEILMRVENDMRGAMIRRYDDDVECLVKLEIIIFHELFNKRFFLAQFFFTF